MDYTYLESSLSISLKIMNIFIFNDFWVFVLCFRTKTLGKARLLSLQFSGTAVEIMPMIVLQSSLKPRELNFHVCQFFIWPNHFCISESLLLNFE